MKNCQGLRGKRKRYMVALMEQETNKSLVIAVIITFVIAFWIGFFVGWLITGRSGESARSANWPASTRQGGLKTRELGEEEATTQNLFSPNSEENTIKVENQLAGRSARIASVSLAQEGWAVIHEDSDGAPGAILGAAWLPAGSRENVEVDLLRGMEAGRRYYAMLHGEVKEESENEESHIFNLEKDLPTQDAQGVIITTSFETISSPN